VGVAALVLGIIGLVFSIIPFVPITQIVGILLSIVGLILGVVGRKQASEQGLPTGTATAGVVLGILGVVFGALIFGSCMYCLKRVGDVGSVFSDELKKKIGSPEFKQAMEKARLEREKAVKEVGKELQKALEQSEKK
jgi:drug/metabolite transporter (DMT)-like permease